MDRTTRPTGFSLSRGVCVLGSAARSHTFTAFSSSPSWSTDADATLSDVRESMEKTGKSTAGSCRGGSFRVSTRRWVVGCLACILALPCIGGVLIDRVFPFVMRS
ncbi:unnamed protein product [Rhizoctonia solani]|uniref:Uncharacterized protein n=1 Tax=Rhizoctonia solani TaxID=456999 RepID=A0A8H3E0Q3_9AGAM|nr:unnamed protein product [Rhizoctonia solani]